MPPKPKSDQATVQKRVDRAEELFAELASYRQVREALVREFKISERTAERDIAEVYRRWAEAAIVDRGPYRGRIRSALWRLAQDARGAEDLPSALRALGQLSRLDGIDAAQELKVENHVTGHGAFDPLSLTPLEREKRIEELLAKRAAMKKAIGKKEKTNGKRH